MNMVGSLAAKSVDGSSCAEEKKRWQDWELIAKALSLDEEKLLVCLGAQAKALLFWMHGGLDGRPSIEFQVSAKFRLHVMQCKQSASSSGGAST